MQGPASPERPGKSGWLRHLIGTLRPAFGEIVWVSLFVNMLALAAPIFVLQVYDRVVMFAGLATLKGLVLGMAVAIVFDFMLRQARSRMLQRVAMRVDIDAGRALFHKVQALPLAMLERRPSAFWQTVFRDVETVRNTLSGQVAVTAADLPFSVLFVAVLLVIAWPIAWVLLITLPAFVLLAWLSGRALERRLANERQAAYARDGLVAEAVAGRAAVKAFAAERALAPEWERRHAATIDSAIERGTVGDAYVNISMGLVVANTVALTSVGALAILDQRLTIGALIAANMLSMRVVAPFQQLVGCWRQLGAARAAVSRLGTVFDEAGERETPGIALDQPAGRIKLERVTFRYAPDMRPAVDRLDLDLKPGSFHAVVGRNGCGKTTLIKLLQGLYAPESGRVTLDGADVRQFTRAQLAQWIGYAPQESVLFAGTIRDNITLRTPGIADEEVVEAAKLAGAHAAIAELPDGYGTRLGEGGGRLSNGLRRRIALARAFAGSPPVIVLDEPSGDLDIAAEAHLVETLRHLAASRLVVAVTHSKALLEACDFVVALDGGQLAIAGPARTTLPRLFGSIMAPGKEPAK